MHLISPFQWVLNVRLSYSSVTFAKSLYLVRGKLHTAPMMKLIIDKLVNNGHSAATVFIHGKFGKMKTKFLFLFP